jgi:hypothetical protein
MKNSSPPHRLLLPEDATPHITEPSAGDPLYVRCDSTGSWLPKQPIKALPVMLYHFRARLPVLCEPCNPYAGQLAEQIPPAKLARVLPLPVLLEKHEASYMQHPDLLEELTEKIEERLLAKEAHTRTASGTSLMAVVHRAEAGSQPIRA